MSENVTKHQRDFVDFLIGLFNNWKIFILILGLFIALGFNYEKNHNDNYKFDLEISIEDQSTLQGLVNYISQLESANFDYTVSAKAQIINVPVKLDYSAFSSDLCGFLKTAIYDHQFYEGMAYVYTKALDEYSLEMDDPEVISVTLKDMITIPTTHGICTLFKISGKLADVNFLQALLVDFLNGYLKNEVYSRLVILRDFNLELASREENDKGIEVLGLMELPLTDINYIKYNTGEVEKTIGPFFVYVFSIFLAFLTHVIFVLSSDLVRQVRQRL
jgi:hypothetical protein